MIMKKMNKLKRIAIASAMTMIIGVSSITAHAQTKSGSVTIGLMTMNWSGTFTSSVIKGNTTTTKSAYQNTGATNVHVVCKNSAGKTMAFTAKLVDSGTPGVKTRSSSAKLAASEITHNGYKGSYFFGEANFIFTAMDPSTGNSKIVTSTIKVN